jgi:DNA-binding response OmpR family regulator
MEALVATILIVEDEELTRTALRYVLTTKGYQVLEARDGQEGVVLFSHQPDAIDLVLSDLMMPRLDGLEMLQAFKQLRPTVKQILITAMPGDVQAWREQGVYDWLAKPFSMEQLLQRVAAALAA